MDWSMIAGLGCAFGGGLLLGSPAALRSIEESIRREGWVSVHSTRRRKIRIVGHIEHEIRKDKWVREDME